MITKEEGSIQRKPAKAQIKGKPRDANHEELLSLMAYFRFLSLL
jgi:hypothetical protein